MASCALNEQRSVGRLYLFTCLFVLAMHSSTHLSPTLRRVFIIAVVFIYNAIREMARDERWQQSDALATIDAAERPVQMIYGF